MCVTVLHIRTYIIHPCVPLCIPNLRIHVIQCVLALGTLGMEALGKDGS